MARFGNSTQSTQDDHETQWRQFVDRMRATHGPQTDEQKQDVARRLPMRGDVAKLSKTTDAGQWIYCIEARGNCHEFSDIASVESALADMNLPVSN